MSTPPTKRAGQAQHMVKIIYEDKDFIALNKPAGILVHGTRISNLQIPRLRQGFGGQAISKERTLVEELLKLYPEMGGVGDDPENRPGIVHRLDKDTSGVLIVARNQKFFDYLKGLFQKHEVKKTYLALVWGEISSGGMIDEPIGLKPGTIKRSVRYKNLPIGRQTLKMVKEAITEYKPLKKFSLDGENFTLLELNPKTGRTHQLRIHLASIHHSIVGDSLYGPKKNPWNLERQFLHAKSIEFSSMSGKRIKLEAEMPEELKRILENLEYRI